MTSPSDAQGWARLISPNFEVKGGSKYRFGLYSQQGSGGVAQIILQFYDEFGSSIIGTSAVRVDPSDGLWLDTSNFFVAPENAVTADVMVQLRILPSSGAPRTLTIYVDDVSVREVVE